jgi:hypothetical protein
MALCHSIRVVDNVALGDPIELEMLSFSGWVFLSKHDLTHTFSLSLKTVSRKMFPQNQTRAWLSQVEVPSWPRYSRDLSSPRI